MKHSASRSLVTVCLALCSVLACNPTEDDTDAHSDGARGSSEGGSGGQSSEPDTAGGSAGVMGMGATSGGGGDTGAASGGGPTTTGANDTKDTSSATSATSATSGAAGFAGQAGAAGAAGDVAEDGEGGEPGEDDEGDEDGCSIPETPGDLPVCSDQFTMTVTCLSGPCAQQVYIHTYDVTWTGFQFSGTGAVTESGTTFTESICGSVSDGELTFHVVYTTVAAGYTIDGTGTLGEDNTASGLSQGVDPRGATQQLGFEVSPMSVGCE